RRKRNDCAVGLGVSTDKPRLERNREFDTAAEFDRRRQRKEDFVGRVLSRGEGELRDVLDEDPAALGLGAAGIVVFICAAYVFKKIRNDPDAAEGVTSLSDGIRRHAG